MKYLTLVLLAFSLSALGSEMLLENVEHHPYKLYKNFKVTPQGVKVSALVIDGEEEPENTSFKVSLQNFNHSKRVSEYVFRTSATRGYGSAVLLGGNYVLTNLHVISKIKNPNTKCNHFKINTPAFGLKKEKFKCKKVLYCSKPLDFCLVEMFDGNKGTKLKDLATPVLNTFQGLSQSERITAVGNPSNFGIYASSGFGLENFGPYRFKFYAPVYHGNSGGGIFNDQAELVGLVYGMSLGRRSSDDFNAAIKLSTIRQILSKELKNSQEILSTMNWK
jgi:S1-C subfamily serine protease